MHFEYLRLKKRNLLKQTNVLIQFTFAFRNKKISMHTNNDVYLVREKKILYGKKKNS